MFDGYFLGLWLGAVLIILGIEFYYYIVARYIEKDLTTSEAIIFIFCLLISIAILILPFRYNKNIFLGIFSIVPLPLVDLIIRAIVGSKEKIQQHIDEEKQLQNWLYTIEKQPENVNAYVAIGDIYFHRNEFEKALDFYQRAQKIMDMPYIMERIKVTEKELKIKNRTIWVCPECSFDNPGDIERCKVCGYTRTDRDLFRDIKYQKKELIKGILFIIVAPVGVIFFIALYIIMPVYLALIITMLIIYLTIRFFCTY
ncbi:MAG TPA: hypothetical protein P5065_08975 [Candidatus Ratteibacteria bacterium]|jgi:tetratricopeptide (TPR) repeat protein|nr:hypothetical protein [bacterium]HQL65391.1 hypothetical protein [bacterium]HRS07149.1 hypothetical protein [Candidatus Ratteibacteria bacterium]HRV05205.1 hypothetical protein [Candidatus Ratteibacteria bacterium]